MIHYVQYLLLYTVIDIWMQEKHVLHRLVMNENHHPLIRETQDPKLIGCQCSHYIHVLIHHIICSLTYAIVSHFATVLYVCPIFSQQGIPQIG